ncbi:gelsolin-related protein of 125 kDa-like [Durio zibethinus]|uniref:Gelsolin-related protein of 125 kDa-like n=1 Tax=Durio zibethinus TaxID=66656 RepID=A0A6P6A8H2_DURZI|nr:gelsolin-related protein of 125 kDa-like [Durio zibethinus]
MGCGESKHVATGNTISRKNSGAGSKSGKTSETIQETSKHDSKTSLILVKEEGQNVNQDSYADNSRDVADVKGMAENKELKKEGNVENDKEKKTGVVKENEEPVEGIAFERLSIENVKVADALEVKKLSEETKEETLEGKELAQETKIETKQETVVDKNLAEETKEETDEDITEDKKLAKVAKEETLKDQKLAEEKKGETANGEAETVKKEKLVKETEAAETTEAKVSTPGVKEEEKPAVSPADDLKTE